MNEVVTKIFADGFGVMLLGANLLAAAVVTAWLSRHG